MHLPFDSILPLIHHHRYPHTVPEKQRLSGPVTRAGSHWTEASGVLTCFGIINH